MLIPMLTSARVCLNSSIKHQLNCLHTLRKKHAKNPSTLLKMNPLKVN